MIGSAHFEVSMGSLRFVVVALVVLVGACSGVSKDACNNGVDDDGDGLTDDLDPGCEFNGGNAETPDPVACNDGVDNDGDGTVDAEDFGCETDKDEDETDPVTACNDGVDNDGDTKVDFGGDLGCESPVDNDEGNAPECQDFIDNDGDVKVDYPFDPGCETEFDDTEADPATPPACSNGTDDDGDGTMDYPGDPGCRSAGDDDEFNTVVGACGPSVAIAELPPSGEFIGSFDEPKPNELSSPVCRGFGGEYAFTYTVSTPNKALRVTTDFPETTVDTVVYVRTACRDGATELGCDDGSGALTGESDLTVPDAPPNTYYIIVDAYGPGSLGGFKLKVTEVAGVGGTCTPGVSECADGLTCHAVTAGAPTTCAPFFCADGLDNDADGKIDFPAEPGCTMARDDDEANPAVLPECGNGGDDDGDALVDYPADLGCKSASDAAEIDECIPGVPVESVIGGVTTGTTAGGTAMLRPPTGCGSSAAGTPERVFLYRNTQTLTNLRLTTAGSAFDAMIYVRHDDCAVEGPRTYCDTDSGGGTVSVVNIPTPAPGDYYVVVDGESSATGMFTLNITGEIAAGAACSASDANFVCTAGFTCGAGSICVASACNDASDNDGDGRADAADPGCESISDTTEANPAVLPLCGNGLDDDADTFIDFPLDIGCVRASDNNEVDCADRDPIQDVTHSGGRFFETTRTRTNDFAAPAPCSVGSGAAPDVAHLFKVPGRTTVTADTCGTGFDTTIMIQQDCTANPPLACDDDASITGCSSQSQVVDVVLEAGSYYIIVDGYTTSSGLYQLNIVGTVGDGERCDPLQVVPGFLACSTGRTCRDVGTGMRCQ